MTQNSTRETTASVEEFIAGVENDVRRTDAATILALMRRMTGLEPKMWGHSIIGFGSYHYRYDSGREGYMPRIGFSPRKANLALYFMARAEGFQDLLDRLGKHSTGVSCVYVKRLSDIDPTVLEALVEHSWAAATKAYGAPS
jgi:hypothetical protein